MEILASKQKNNLSLLVYPTYTQRHCRIESCKSRSQRRWSRRAAPRLAAGGQQRTNAAAVRSSPVITELSLTIADVPYRDGWSRAVIWNIDPGGSPCTARSYADSDTGVNVDGGVINGNVSLAVERGSRAADSAGSAGRRDPVPGRAGRRGRGCPGTGRTARRPARLPGS